MTAWNTEQSTDFSGPLDITRAATAVVDAQDTVIGWSSAAEQLLGYQPHEILGRPLNAFLSPGPVPPARPLPPQLRGNEIRVARHRDGRELIVATAVCPLSGAGTAERVLVATELKDLRQWESQLALLHGLTTQSPVGLAIYDTDLRLTWCNAAYEREIGRPFAEFRGFRADELYSEGVFVSKGHPPTLDAVMHQVLDTGEPFLDLHFLGRPPSDPETDHLWSCAYYRLQDANGHVFGVCEDAFDISDRYRAQRRLALLVEAGRGIGTALDVPATAEKITEVAVPEFAATVTVDLPRAVLEGEVPATSDSAAISLVRVARRPAGEAGRGNRNSSSQDSSRLPLPSWATHPSRTGPVRRRTAASHPAGSYSTTRPWSCRCAPRAACWGSSPSSATAVRPPSTAAKWRWPTSWSPVQRCPSTTPAASPVNAPPPWPSSASCCRNTCRSSQRSAWPTATSPRTT